MKRITDKTFVYTPSFETDIGKRFERMRREKRALDKAAADREAARQSAVVQPMRKGSKP